MAEHHASRPGRWFAFGGALVLALLGVAFLGWSIAQHQDARDELTRVRAQLATNQASSSKEAQALQRAQQAVSTVQEQLAALSHQFRCGIIPLASARHTAGQS